MNKQQILEQYFKEVSYNSNLNYWFVNSNGVPYKISDYVLSNIILNAKTEHRKEEIFERLQSIN